MIVMASKKQGINQLRKKVDESKEKYLNDIFSQIKTVVTENPRNWGNLTDVKNKESQSHFAILYRTYFESFTETYKITSVELKQLYKEISDFNVKDLYDLTYKSDGKTFDDRLYEYWREAQERLNKRRESAESVINWLQNRCELILNTETRVIESKVKDNKKPVHASLIVIDSGCETCQGGEYPIGESIDLPPFHPNCQCNWWYEETDEPDDIKDLDLEIEE